ncbi:MAG: DUF748 domain-containing protein, partial [Bacteriovorax sp.]|nr:DUF748 domain-containing protein [Rhizobacter sp.]
GTGTRAFFIEVPLTDREAELDVRLGGLSIGAFAPYLAPALAPSIEGQLAARAQVDWLGATEVPRPKLVLGTAMFDAFRLRGGPDLSAQGAVSLKPLTLTNVQLDVVTHAALAWPGLARAAIHWWSRVMRMVA